MRTIEVKNGVKQFGERCVLKNVSIQCESGHIYGIVGHNGSGKTVLFKCICGFMNLDDGEIIIDGVPRSKKGAILTGAGIIIEEPMNGLDHKGVDEMEMGQLKRIRLLMFSESDAFH